MNNVNGSNVTGGDVINREDDGYLRDLFGMTAKASNLEKHTEHPDFPASSAGNIHSSSNTALHPRDDAARRNVEYLASHPSHDISPYHEDRPVISYRTDMETDNMSRVHADKNKVGPFTTRTADIRDESGNYSTGQQAMDDLSLKRLPTHATPVRPDIGTDVLASKPISDSARQYELLRLVESWFGPSTKLG